MSLAVNRSGYAARLFAYSLRVWFLPSLDRVVYQLYGLSEEEVAIVEEGR